jgi:hypothetical protein
MLTKNLDEKINVYFEEGRFHQTFLCEFCDD